MQTIGLDAAEDEPSKVSYNEGRSKIRYRNKHPSAKVAQAAVAKAIAVLEEFYAKAADATSLVQTRQPEGISDKPYKGMGGASGGIIGMLEVIGVGLQYETTVN